MDFPGGSVVKNSPANAGDVGLISGSGRSPGVGNGNPLSSILAWMIPWTEEPGRLQSMRSGRSDTSTAGYFRQARMWQAHATLHTLISCSTISHCFSMSCLHLVNNPYMEPGPNYSNWVCHLGPAGTLTKTPVQIFKYQLYTNTHKHIFMFFQNTCIIL